MPKTRQNSVFTDQEKSTMEVLLSKIREYEGHRDGLRRQLEEIDGRITHVKSQYGAIYNNKNQLLNFPVEVTCLIFAYSQLRDKKEENQDEEEEEVEVEEKSFFMEVTVSHVCRVWRTISLGYPQLWTSFYCESISSPSTLERFDAYMERSVSLPLCIWFYFRSIDSPDQNTELMGRAVNHAHRWKHFTMISETFQSSFGPTSRLRDVSAPMLEYLTLLPDEEMDNDWLGGIEPVIFKGGAPRLTYLLLDGSCRIFPPLSNLTTLRLEKRTADGNASVPTSTFIGLLGLPSLEHLSIAGDFIDSVGEHRRIDMPKLKRLRVSELDAFWDILPSIHAPHLENLMIHSCDFNDRNSPSKSTQKHDSFPALRQLSVIETSMADSQVRSFAKITNSAIHVFLADGDLDDSLFQTIADQCANTIWPRLKTLTCNIEGYTGINPYLTFARKRRKKSFTLRLHKELVQYWKDEEHDNLKVLKTASLVEAVEDAQVHPKESFWPEDLALGFQFDIGPEDPFFIDSYY